MNYTIRELNPSEYGVLEDFLYEAIFVPEGALAPPKSIINQPELQLYISEFGNKNDNALVAKVNGKIIGAVWMRIMNDYVLRMMKYQVTMEKLDKYGEENTNGE